MNLKRRIVTEEVESIVNYDATVDLSLNEVIKTLQEAIERIPERYKFAAVLRVRALGDYANVSIDVTYDRLETDTEYHVRLDRDNQYKHLQETRERETYERLKQKFEAS